MFINVWRIDLILLQESVLLVKMLKIDVWDAASYFMPIARKTMIIYIR